MLRKLSLAVVCYWVLDLCLVAQEPKFHLLYRLTQFDLALLHQLIEQAI